MTDPLAELIEAVGNGIGVIAIRDGKYVAVKYQESEQFLADAGRLAERAFFAFERAKEA